MKPASDYGATNTDGAAKSKNGSPLLAHIAFVLTGAAICIPWQAYICSLDYFMKLLPGTPIQFFVGTVNMGVLLLMTFLMIPLSHLMHPVLAQFGSGAGAAIVLTVIPAMNTFLVLPAATPVVSVNILFLIVCISLMLSAALNAIMQSTLYGLAAELSVESELTASAESGKGVAGLAIVAARMITKAAFDPDLNGLARSTTWFFAIGFVLILLSLVAFAAMLQLPVIMERRGRHESDSSARLLTNASPSGSQELSSTSSVFLMVWRQALSVMVVFATTLACFPGLTATLQSVTFSMGDWFPIVLIGLYNVGDLIGKTLPGYWSVFQNHADVLPYCAILHAGFLPLFLVRLLHAGIGDIYAFFLVFILGVVTGYLGCSAMMLGPEQCVKPRDRDMAGKIDTVFLVSGLALGSFAGLGINQIFVPRV